MRDLDPSLQLVVCGSSNVHLPTYLQWDRKVLEYVGDDADYISVHRYVDNHANDTPAFLATGLDVDRQIEQTDGLCRYVQGKRKSQKRAYICFDEYNVWYRNMQIDGQWQEAPHLIEEEYNLEDALVIGGFLNSFVRHADSVKIANIAQIVNVIAPLLTTRDGLLKQTIFYPLAMFANRRQGISLRTAIDGPEYRTQHHQVPYLDCSAILDNHTLHLFLVNRSVNEKMPLVIQTGGAEVQRLINGECLTGPDPKAGNTLDRPDAVVPAEFSEVTVDRGTVRTDLPPLSLTALSLALS
jgi:alpha-N-arabinofuranosidase